ncbi:MAG TPA: hypothetical protein PKV13_12085 [Propionicimonas sp.]|nr:hypothetical protein [Propionicimonas sp.]HRA07341.1 hypothetical protein [Propionicimonas sp.]
MALEGDGRVTTSASLQYELESRLNGDAAEHVGKFHVSVRWEPLPAVARVGAMIENYDWDNRMRTLRVLRAFEADHAEDFALEYDIIPLEAVTDEAFVDA